MGVQLILSKGQGVFRGLPCDTPRRLQERGSLCFPLSLSGLGWFSKSLWLFKRNKTGHLVLWAAWTLWI